MIKLVAVGKIKEKALQSLSDEYIKRLGPDDKLTMVEVDDEIIPQSNSEAENEQAKEKEGKRILSKIKDGEYVILLDLHGQMYDSVQLSKKLDDIRTRHTSQITFVIGGSLGLSEEVVARANMRWKLSDLTFTHQMTRLLVLEQIYRCFKIQRNEPYHK